MLTGFRSGRASSAVEEHPSPNHLEYEQPSGLLGSFQIERELHLVAERRGAGVGSGEVEVAALDKAGGGEAGDHLAARSLDWYAGPIDVEDDGFCDARQREVANNLQLTGR